MATNRSASQGKRFEFNDGKSQKFWTIRLDGSSHTVQFGRIGTGGQTQTKSFGSEAEARASYDKLIKQKTGKGYTVVGPSAEAAKPSAATASKTKRLFQKPIPSPRKPGPRVISETVSKKAQKPRPAKASKSDASGMRAVATPPKLYHVTHDAWEGGNEALVINCVDMDLQEWSKQFDQLERTSGSAGKPLPVMVERHGRESDCPVARPVRYVAPSARGEEFRRAGRVPTTISMTGWAKLRRFLEGHGTSVPVVTTREILPGEFRFPKLAARQQRKYVFFFPGLSIPFRHGQDLVWNAKKSTFTPRCQDKSLPKKPMIDPAEFAGAALFRLDAYVVATETFVRAFQDAKLTGLKFSQFDYLPTPRVKLAAPTARLEPIPEFPEALVAKGWSKELAQWWEAMWDWTYRGLKSRGWPAQRARKKPPVAKEKLDAFERKGKLKLPPRFRAVLEKYSASVTVDHGFVESTDPLRAHLQNLEERVGSFMFQGAHVLWDFSLLKDFPLWRDCLVDVHGFAPGNVRSVPFLTAGNGDQVTVDVDTEEIHYWSTEGERELTHRLAADMLDFVTRWSWLGVPTIDFVWDTPFYDRKNRCLRAQDVTAVKRWHGWLQGHDVDSAPGGRRSL